MSRYVIIFLTIGLGTSACDWPMGVTRPLEPTPDCGDAYLTDDEQCDDGNAQTETCAYDETSCNVCSSNCELIAGSLIFCGDAVLQNEDQEECDEGGLNSDSGGCLSTCLFAQCGDGHTREDAELGTPGYEECDDANDDDEDACIADCLLATCGDGFVQRDVEFCDDGIESQECNDDCTLAQCGDGKTNAAFGEECDDSNTITEACEDSAVPCMVCGQDCVMVPGARCGDGVVDTVYGETCDDGNLEDDLNGCSEDCQINSVCGDGIVQELTEFCDDGYVDGCGSCNEDCSGEGVTSVCGDGIVCEEDEECDAGEENNTDIGACLSTCQLAACGDGHIREDLEVGELGYETCDDGDAEDTGNGCSENCASNSLCGDGIVQALIEVCDDGYVDACGDCNEDCSAAGDSFVCGDGDFCPQFEECDDGNTRTEVCEYGGLTNCTVCDSICEESVGAREYCGDGTLQTLYETCDLGVDNTEDCPEGVVECVVCSNQCLNEPGVPNGDTVSGGSCDGEVLVTYYRDLDSDGFGDINNTLDLCYQPPGYALDNTDCNDAATMVNPGAPEQCNQLDDNCNDVIDEGILGTGQICPAVSCKAVLDDHLPLGSGEYWLGDLTLSELRFCDFGNVGDGWTWKKSITVTNSTDAAWMTQQVKVLVDILGLTTGGMMKASGEDIRFFTDNGILLEYWIGQKTDAGTEIWIIIPELEPLQQVNVMMAYGNGQADMKSSTTFYDDFRENSFSRYNTLGDMSWGPGRTFEWLTETSHLRAASFIDYFLMIRPELIGLTETIYIEVKGFWEDGEVDGLGPAFRSTTGEYYVGQVTDDYDGEQFSTGFDGVVRYDTLPTDHQQGIRLGFQQDLISTAPGLRVGMLVSSSAVQLYVDGALLEQVTFEEATTVSWVGLASISNIGCEYDYLWVGRSVPNFNPTSATDAPLATALAQEPF